MNNLKDLRLEKGFNMREAAAALKLPYTTYVGYEKGEREPGSDVLIKIANYYNTSVDYILAVENASRNTNTYNLKAPTLTDDVVVFPVIGELAAGYEHIALENWGGETIEIPFQYLRGHKKEDFIVLKVKGDSMYPMYQNDDVVLVLKQDTMNHSGEIGAVLYEDEFATLKKIEYVEGEDWMKLVPLNPEYMPKTITGENLEHCRVIGVPKLLIREIN